MQFINSQDMVKQEKLEQLERLRSEDTHTASWLPYYWVILDPKWKEYNIKVTNF